MTDRMELGLGSATYSTLKFSRYHLQSDDGSENPNEDLLDAVSKLELWYTINVQMIKAMGLQRDYILFFMACTKTDQIHFSEMLRATYGEDPETNEPSKSLAMALQAMQTNVAMLKIMKDEIGMIMRSSTLVMNAVYREHTAWKKEWRKEEVWMAPIATTRPSPGVCRYISLTYHQCFCLAAYNCVCTPFVCIGRYCTEYCRDHNLIPDRYHSLRHDE